MKFKFFSCNPAPRLPSWVQSSFSILTFPASQSLNWSWIRNSFLSRLILSDHSLPTRRPVQIFMILKRSACARLPRKANEILSFMNEGKRFSCLRRFRMLFTHRWGAMMRATIKTRQPSSHAVISSLFTTGNLLLSTLSTAFFVRVCNEQKDKEMFC